MDIVKSVVDANGIGYLADILEQHGGYDIRQGVSVADEKRRIIILTCHSI